MTGEWVRCVERAHKRINKYTKKKKRRASSCCVSPASMRLPMGARASWNSWRGRSGSITAWEISSRALSYSVLMGWEEWAG